MTEKKAAAKDAVAAENGVRIAAPAGMESISVGGIAFQKVRDDLGAHFVVPEALARAALAHVKSFENAATREAKRAEAEAARLIAEADLPGRIARLEERLAALEAMLGTGVNRN